MTKIAVVVGTRPEIIKESPIIKECEARGLDYFVIHTGQHYSYNMEKLFFEQLELPEPKYSLGIKSTAPYMQGEHTGKMLIEIEKILLGEKPDVVLVHGDTNTALAGALTTKKLSTTESFTGIKIMLGHVEAGLRSNDNTMPEEINRRIADHLSDYLFAPTQAAARNAVSEGVDKKKVMVTGNTIVDALMQARQAAARTDVLDRHSLSKRGYFLATVHRQENVDSKEKFSDILNSLGRAGRRFGMPVIYPIHPRSQKLMQKFSLAVPKDVRLIDPVGFMEFLQLESNAALVFTDSGGVQEEACVFGVPCVTLRENTERPETVEVGGNTIAGTKPESVEAAAEKMMNRPRSWKNPFGDGTSAKKIIDFITEQ